MIMQQSHHPKTMQPRRDAAKKMNGKGAMLNGESEQNKYVNDSKSIQSKKVIVVTMEAVVLLSTERVLPLVAELVM